MKAFQIQLLMVSFFSTLAFGQSTTPNLPEASHMKNVGRVVAFPTFKQNIWFSPTAFSVDLDCTSGSESACSVRVYNKLSDAELEGLNLLTKREQQLLFFADVDMRVVGGIQDQFNFLPSLSESASSMLMNTLAMSDHFPYAQFRVRLDRSEAQNIQRLYETSGLGTFQSRFHVNGEWTEDYLSIQNTVPVLSVLRNLVSNPRSLPEIKTQLMAAIRQSSIQSNNFTTEEANILAYRYLVTTYLVKSGSGNYSVLANSLPQVKSPMVLINENQAVRLNCRALLALRKNAVSTTACSQE